jgi:hypothetical protein
MSLIGFWKIICFSKSVDDALEIASCNSHKNATVIHVPDAPRDKYCVAYREQE